MTTREVMALATYPQTDNMYKILVVELKQPGVTYNTVGLNVDLFYCR